MSNAPPPIPEKKVEKQLRQFRSPYGPPKHKTAGAAAKPEQKPESLQCSSCGGKISVSDKEDTVMVVCEFCGTAQDVTVPGQAQVLFKFKRDQQPYYIPMGVFARYRNQPYKVIGRVRYIENDGYESYIWNELQLYNPKRGYIFLGEEDGHWVLHKLKRNHKSLPNPRELRRGQFIKAYGERYKVFEMSQCQIDYVEGELSWIAKKDDRVYYVDAIKPPQIISAEWTDKELEWYVGEYMTKDQVARMFSIKEERLPDPVGVSPAQPFRRSREQKWMMVIGFIAAAVFTGLVLASAASNKASTSVVNTIVNPGDYLSDSGALTLPFQVTKSSQIHEIKVSANVNNSWVGLSMAFVDEADTVQMDADAGMGYYKGYSGGEHWSEGSRSDSAMFRLEGPKTYKLNIFGSGGRWPHDSGPGREQIQLKLTQGVVPLRYFAIGIILCLIFPIYEVFRQAMFEGKRWNVGDDDDD